MNTRWRRSRASGPWLARPRKKFTPSCGLDYIPPELRENTGEIDAAAEHRLPHLIELDRHARRPADAHDGQRRQELDRGNGAGGEGAGLRIYFADRSQQGRNRRQRPGRKANARTDQENSRGQRQASGHPRPRQQRSGRAEERETGSGRRSARAARCRAGLRSTPT